MGNNLFKRFKPCHILFVEFDIESFRVLHLRLNLHSSTRRINS